MPSSWNTGTLVETAVDAAVESATKAVKEGPSFFDTVINNASQAMTSGAEIVSDAAESVYELIPEADAVKESIESQISKIPEPKIPSLNISQIDKNVTDTRNKQNENFGTSEFRFFLSNLFQTGSKLTEKDFNETDIITLTEVVKRAKSEGLDSVDYNYFGTSEGEVLKGGIFAGLFDPKLRMARTTGGFKFYENEKGETVISNTYNFNAGTKRKAFYEAKKEGDSTSALNILLKSALNPVELMSILAYSKQEELREKGKPFESELEINLGVL